MPLNHEPGFSERYLRGEQNALEFVYRKHVDGVCRLLRFGFFLDTQGGKRVPGVGSQEELKDLLQEVFARTFSQKARVSYDAERPFRPYVQRIAKNILVDHGRRLGRGTRLESALKEELEQREAKSIGAELNLDDRRSVEVTTAFVSTLDEPFRSLYQKRYEEGLSQMQVAAAMGKTRKQVRLLETKLRSMLRVLLSEKGLCSKEFKK